MKKEKNLELLKSNLKKLENFRVYYDGEDFGIYHYNSLSKRYEGSIGYLSLETILKAIKDDNYFIQVETLG